MEVQAHTTPESRQVLRSYLRDRRMGPSKRGGKGHQDPGSDGQVASRGQQFGTGLSGPTYPVDASTGLEV